MYPPGMGLGSWLRRTFSASPRQFNYESPAFSALIKGMFGQPANGRYGFDTRADAMQIPAIRKGRNLICSISTLPLETINDRNQVVDHPLMRQFDSNVPNVVLVAQTIEDLLFDAIAWWEVTGRTADDYPSTVIRHSDSQVSLQPPADYQQGWLPSDKPTHGVIYMRGKPVPYRDVIRFDSPNPPLLKDAERVIRRAIALYLAAELYADEPRPMDYFTPVDAFSDPDDTVIEAFLEQWARNRKRRKTAFVPGILTYNEVQQPTPADLQLVQLQQRVNIDLANLIGLDPEDVGESTTSRTYQNQVDRRKDRINDLFSPYMAAITQRLSMPDVTKRRERVRFRLDDYLRADPFTRAQVNQIYIDTGVVSREWVAKDEGLPPEALGEAPQTPVPVPVSPATVREINSAAPSSATAGGSGE